MSARPSPPAVDVPAGYQWTISISRWFYCSEHMFGRWIEDGHVVMWTVQPTVPA